MINLFSNIFSKKQNNIFGNIKAKVPKTAQDTIPFIEAYENGLFLTGENTYTLIFAYNNIDYFLFRDDEKEDIYEKYMRLLNTLPSDIEYQEFTMNTEVILMCFIEHSCRIKTRKKNILILQRTIRKS